MQDYEPYHKYSYNGPVMEFDKLVANYWKGETMASSKAKAKSNLAYQYKKQNNRSTRAKVTLPGEIEMVS